MRTDTELQLLLLNKTWNWVSLALATFLQNTNFTFAKMLFLIILTVNSNLCNGFNRTLNSITGCALIPDNFIWGTRPANVQNSDG